MHRMNKNVDDAKTVRVRPSCSLQTSQSRPICLKSQAVEFSEEIIHAICHERRIKLISPVLKWKQRNPSKISCLVKANEIKIIN